MGKRRRKRSILLFAAKFLIFVTVLVVAWWAVLPYYGYGLAQVSGAILRFALGVPIEYARLDAAGMLNTESRLVFGLGGREPRMPVALLVTNVPPYLALVAATAGLAMRRRLRILALGTGILCAGHVAFIVVALRFGEALRQVSEIPTAVAQFYLTLPFLLWIVFAYWDRLASYLGEERRPPSA
jgi:hypothetical protein